MFIRDLSGLVNRMNFIAQVTNQNNVPDYLNLNDYLSKSETD
jgi:hypothetical protein